MYIAQQAFTTGEISPEVLARSELDKYQYALKQARNVYIRPYGAVYRRSGTVYHSACKYADKKAILVEFNFSVELSYMLEIGAGYIRVAHIWAWNLQRRTRKQTCRSCALRRAPM